MTELENQIPCFIIKKDSEAPPELLEAINIFLGIIGQEGMSGEISFQEGMRESSRSIEIKFGYDEDGFLTQTKILRFDYLGIYGEVLIRKWNKDQQKFEQALTLQAAHLAGQVVFLAKELAEIAGIKVEIEDIEDIKEQLPRECLVSKNAEI